MRRAVLAMALLFPLTACAAGVRVETAKAAASGPDARRAGIARGQAFVQRACAGCHAVGLSDASRNEHAPPFRELAAHRSDADLTRELGEISRDGHLEMPPIYVTPTEMADVVAYMRSLTGRTT